MKTTEERGEEEKRHVSKIAVWTEITKNVQKFILTFFLITAFNSGGVWSLSGGYFQQ